MNRYEQARHAEPYRCALEEVAYGDHSLCETQCSPLHRYSRIPRDNEWNPVNIAQAHAHPQKPKEFAQLYSTDRSLQAHSLHSRTMFSLRYEVNVARIYSHRIRLAGPPISLPAPSVSCDLQQSSAHHLHIHLGSWNANPEYLAANQQCP
ncbi:hypothetical protein D3C73_924680 [compost metagenome]